MPGVCKGKMAKGELRLGDVRGDVRVCDAGQEDVSDDARHVCDGGAVERHAVCLQACWSGAGGGAGHK